jgi:hypothetical protein
MIHFTGITSSIDNSQDEDHHQAQDHIRLHPYFENLYNNNVESPLIELYHFVFFKRLIPKEKP